MLLDIYNNLKWDSKLILRIFNDLEFYDLTIERDTIEKYNKIFTISCIVPHGNDLIIEGTID